LENSTSQIWILGHGYKIVEKDMDLLGQFDHEKLQISLRENMTKSIKEATLIHEIIEALNYHFELGLEHNKIMSLESGLFQVLNDNDIDLSPFFEAKRIEKS